jgi:hypothetical protein
MTTTTTASQLDRVPIAELATRPDPAAWHEALRALGTCARGDQWIVSTPSDVAAALSAPALRVVPPPAEAGPAADLIARMARFSDGDAHRRRRAAAVRLLPPAAHVAALAREHAARQLREAEPAGELDVMPLARTLPAEVLARALGLSAPGAASAAVLTGRLCDALLSGVPGRAAAAGEAAAGLRATLQPLGLTDADEVAAASILFQARDSTAALIGAAVLGSARPGCGRAADRVEYVLRREAPVQCTRRVATADTTIGTAVVPRGSSVWIFVAAAELGSGQPATFGSGPHGCPAAVVATAITREVVTAVDAGGWRLVCGQRVDYEPRPNLRLPCRVLVSRG